MNRWPDYPTGRKAPALPVAVVCCASWLARKVEVLLPFFLMMSAANLDGEQLLNAISELVSKRNPQMEAILHDRYEWYYPCVNCPGGREAIYTNWCVNLLCDRRLFTDNYKVRRTFPLRRVGRGPGPEKAVHAALRSRNHDHTWSKREAFDSGV